MKKMKVRDYVSQGSFRPGEYRVSAQGHNSSLAMNVTLSEERIEAIEIASNKETKAISSPVFEQVPKAIIEGQTLNVDTVSGATISSEGIIQGVADAIELAGGDSEEIKKRSHYSLKSNHQRMTNCDVVIVGSGGAGMSAAIELHSAGYSPLIVEQMEYIGGNTNRAGGGMNAAYTKYQKALGIEDSTDLFYEETLKGGHNKNDPALVRSIVDHSAEAVDWMNNFGAGLTDITGSGGFSKPRLHRPNTGEKVGPLIVETLSKQLKSLNIPIQTGTQAKRLLFNDQQKIAGVEVEDNEGTYTIQAKAIIIAAGGFSANPQMVEQYDETKKDFNTTNQIGANGSGIQMAINAGADTTDMNYIQIHPTTDPETGALFSESLRGDGAILINRFGNRFTNELLTRDVVSQKELEQDKQIVYLLYTQELVDKNKQARSYVEKGYAVSGNTPTELGEKLKLEKNHLEQTLKNYSEYQQNGVDEDFSRDDMKLSFNKGPYYALPVFPAIHHTMGGLKVDPSMHVYDKENNIMKGLYAAGEATGGVHGANRIGGNAVLDIIVNGRIAGQSSAKYLKGKDL